MQQIFCDEITAISIIEGTVRLDLATVVPNQKDENGNARMMLAGCLVMTVEAFLRSSPRLQEAHRILQEQRLGSPPPLSSAVREKKAPSPEGKKRDTKKNIPDEPLFP